MGNPFISWGIFVTVIGALWYFNQKKKTPVAQSASNATEKAKAVFVAAVPNTEATDSKKKNKKKKKAALSNTTPKDIVSTDDNAASDDDVAQEIDIKHLSAAKAGSKPKSRQGHSPLATASQTSSTGADADIDEEPLIGSSTDPSDMLEKASNTAGVLRIGAPVQPPRQAKAPKAPKEEPGLHANKNQKKKEKKKAEAAAARAEQKSRFEEHRQTVRATEASKPTPPVSAAVSAANSAWTTVNAGKKAAPAAAPVVAPANVDHSALLDTFEPVRPTSSDSETTRILGGSWESIPPHVQAPEPEWNQVKSKKTRATKKADEPAAPAPRAATPPPPPPPAPRAQQQKQRKEKPAAVESAESKTTSGSDWSQVDNLDVWAVHPESD